MSKSPNINLELTPAAEGDKNFQTWRTELAGEDSSSNMMILDTEIGQIKAGYLPTSQKGTPGGVASLDAAGKVPSGQLPAMDYDPAGSAAAVQAELDTHEADKSNPHSVTKTQVGLGNVDNTSDANKPVSTAVQTALDAKADKAVPGAANNVALLDASGNLADSGKALTPAAIGALPAGGTAAAAEKLATVRTIQVNLASTTAANFDGTGNVTPGVTGTLPVALGGTGATTAAAALSNLGAQSKLLSDDTASALGLSGGPTVDDALKASAGKVGDIKTTTRTDLGNDWLLCNGATVSSNTYPELSNLLISTPGSTYSEVTWPDDGYTIVQFDYINGNYVLLTQKSLYYKTSISASWTKSNLTGTTDTSSASYSFESIANGNGYWVVIEREARSGYSYLRYNYSMTNLSGFQSANNQISASALLSFSRLVFGNGKFAIAATLSSNGDGYIWTASNPTSWSSKLLGDDYESDTLCFYDGYFIISYTTSSYGSTFRIYTSEDASTWTSSESISFLYQGGNTCVLSGNIYVHVHNGGSSPEYAAFYMPIAGKKLIEFTVPSQIRGFVTVANGFIFAYTSANTLLYTATPLDVSSWEAITDVLTVNPVTYDGSRYLAWLDTALYASEKTLPTISVNGAYAYIKGR